MGKRTSLSVKSGLKAGKISANHTRALLRLPAP
jgi:hypothetical protein